MGETVRASALFEIFDENTPELSEILDLSMGDNLEGDGAAKYFEDSLKILERDQIERDLKELERRVRRGNRHRAEERIHKTNFATYDQTEKLLT